jgi:hypothetical protein
MKRYGFKTKTFQYTHDVSGKTYNLKYTYIPREDRPIIAIGNYQSRYDWLEAGKPKVKVRKGKWTQQKNFLTAGWSNQPVKLFLEKMWGKDIDILMEWTNLADTKDTWVKYRDTMPNDREMVFFCLLPGLRVCQIQRIGRDGVNNYAKEKAKQKYRAVERHSAYYKELGIRTVIVGKADNGDSDHAYGSIEDNVNVLEGILDD